MSRAGQATSKSDPIESFLPELPERGQVPWLKTVDGSIRIDLREAGHIDSWMITIKHLVADPALPDGGDWGIETFSDDDFDPGFSTVLAVGHDHEMRIAMFADNADTQTLTLRLEAGAGEPTVTNIS